MSVVRIIDLRQHLPAIPSKIAVAPIQLTLETLNNGFGASLLADPHIPLPDEIIAHPGLRARHTYCAQLDPLKRLKSADIVAIMEDPRFDLSITAFGPGSIPASTNPDSTYAKHSWTRDTALVACALKWSGHHEMARAVVENLSIFYGSEPQRSRIVSYHFDSNAAEKYRGSKGHPLIRIPISAKGELTHSREAEDWGHAQLDALAMWLWTAFRFANQGVINLPDLNRRISIINPNNEHESIFIAAIKMLDSIHYWEQDDYGPWEERRGCKRATSVGIAVAALREAKEFFVNNGPSSFPSNKDQQEVWLAPLLERLISSGNSTLNERIQNVPEDSFAIETNTEGVAAHDAALSILLYPFEVGLSDNQQLAILRTLYGLMGEVGFKRYRGDAYVGSDYIHEKNAHLMADTARSIFKEAQWCLFDANLAAYFFRRYELSNGSEPASFRFGQQHLKRALSHITSHPTSYRLAQDNSTVHIPAGACPEAYYYDSRLGASRSLAWIPNSNTPLNWTKAALALALERGHLATRLFEALHSKNLDSDRRRRRVG